MSAKKLGHIEQLRGLSILLVYFFHLELPGFKNGFLGVDIFFVISGFLMARLYGDISTNQEIKNYFTKRLARILPAYYVVIFITVIFSLFLSLNHELEMVIDQAIWSVFFVPNVNFWLVTGYFDYTYFRPLLHLWSLGVELQFYLIFPFIVFLHNRYSKVLILVVFVLFIEYINLSTLSPKSAFFLLSSRLWEFMAGFYIAKSNIGTNTTRSIIGLVALILLVALLVFLPGADPDDLFLITFATVLLSSVVVCFGIYEAKGSNAVSSVLSVIGKYSYSIYLVHFPVIVFFNYIPFGGTRLAPDSVYSTLFITLITLCLSYVLYNVVESNTRHKLTGKQVLKMSIFFAVVVVLLSKPIYHFSRFLIEPAIFNISSAMMDRGTFRCGVFQGKLEPFSESCEITGDDEDTVKRHLLVGDSHADAIKQQLATTLKARQQSLRLVKDSQTLSKLNSPEKIIKEAIKHNINVITLHSRRQIDLNLLEELLIMAQKHQMKVVYIDPVPIQNFSVPYRMFSDFKNNGKLNNKGVSLEGYMRKNKKLLAGISRLTTLHSNFYRYETVGFLCQEYCLIAGSDGIPYYFDNSHLTLTGAALLEPIYVSISELK